MTTNGSNQEYATKTMMKHWKKPIIITMVASEVQAHILAMARSGQCAGNANVFSTPWNPWSGGSQGVNKPHQPR